MIDITPNDTLAANSLTDLNSLTEESLSRAILNSKESGVSPLSLNNNLDSRYNKLKKYMNLGLIDLEDE